MTETAPTIVLENKLPLEDLQAKIKLLSLTEDGEPLKEAMRDLKKALLDNPDACALLLAEDIGECFKAIKRLTAKEIAEEEASKPEKKAKKEKQTQEELMKDLNDDDFI